MPKDFLQTLEEIDRGNLPDECATELAKVVEAVRESGKKGYLQIRLNVKPAARNETKQMEVSAEIKTKEPRPDRPSSIFYADGENNLLRNDPDQTAMEFREVPGENKPLRKVD